MPSPPSRVCPLCASQDYFDTPAALPGGGWQFVCRGNHDVYVFEVDPDNKVAAYPEGLAADLGLYDDLRALITDELRLVEYGVVEHLYGTAHRREYEQLVGIYSHTARPTTPPRKYTASSFIAGALGRLYVLGELTGIFGQATGYWDYNSTISYWCPAGVEPTDELTWEVFAVEQQIDPESWPLLGWSP